jgi:hypothetical protein
MKSNQFAVIPLLADQYPIETRASVRWVHWRGRLGR